MTIQDINQAAFIQELKEIEAESIGWILLGVDAYLHLPVVFTTTETDEATSQEVINVVGVPDASMAGMNVLLLG
jgi:hypothetical protein